ncbi:MAG: hypothetical protein M3146_04640 [Thermoproteota archaeon]|nr:hypothetical protein [Thermoproteota archaeon]
MPVVADSYMGMFLPTDLPEKLVSFVSGELDFPLIRRDEIMGAFYLFGKDYGVSGETEVLAVTDLAKRTIEQVGRNVGLFYRTPNKLSSSAIREDVMKRVLQISVELQQKKVDSGNAYKLNHRIVKDPVILSDFFSQHIAYYQQDYFFELFQPFKKTELPFSLRDKLEGRMLLLAYNVKNLKSLPFESSLSPFIQWLEKPAVNMSKV